MKRGMMLTVLAAIEAACGLVPAAVAVSSIMAAFWLPGPMFVLGMVLWCLAFRARLVRLPGVFRILGAALLAGASYSVAFVGWAWSAGLVDRVWPDGRLATVILISIPVVVASMVLAGALRGLGLGKFWRTTAQLVVAATLAVAAAALLGGFFGNGVFFFGVGQALLALPLGAALIS